jgi:PTS system N-acetylgalactosamine-specific IIA component
MMSDRPRAIVIGHGQFGQGLVSAVDRITGRGDLFVPLSNDGLSCADLEAQLQAAMSAHDIHVIFTDLPAGSCNVAALRLMVGREDVVVVTGANLPALLSFITHPTDGGEVALAERAVDKGASALRAVPGRARAH